MAVLLPARINKAATGDVPKWQFPFPLIIQSHYTTVIQRQLQWTAHCCLATLPPTQRSTLLSTSLYKLLLLVEELALNRLKFFLVVFKSV
jgi:hypothetical protein